MFLESLVVLFQKRIAQMMDGLRVHQAQLVLQKLAKREGIIALSRDLHETIQAARQGIIGLRQEMKRLSQPAYLKRCIKTARRELAS